MSAGGNRTRGLKIIGFDNVTVCWGLKVDENDVPPELELSQVSVGIAHAWGVTTGGQAAIATMVSISRLRELNPALGADCTPTPGQVLKLQ